IQPVLLAGLATNALRVEARRFAVVSLLSVAQLRSDIRSTGLDHRELIASDPARSDFFLSRNRVEAPCGSVLHDGDWKRPSFVPHNERLASAPLIDQPPSFGSGYGEHLTVFPGGGWICSGGPLLPVAAKERDEFLELACFGDAYQFSRGIVGRLERSWRILGCRRRAGERQISDRQRHGEEAASHPGTRAVRTHGDHGVSPRVVRRDPSTTPAAAASRAAAAAAAGAATLSRRPRRSAVGV